MDQLKVHKAVDARPYFTSLNILPIWNVSYSPEFNPIEDISLLIIGLKEGTCTFVI